jgi:hypothetical protein
MKSTAGKSSAKKDEAASSSVRRRSVLEKLVTVPLAITALVSLPESAT